MVSLIFQSAVGVDLGGTKLLLRYRDHILRFATGPDFGASDLTEILKNFIEQYVEPGSVIGVAVPGLVERNTVIACDVLPKLVGWHANTLLSRKLGKVALANDANAALHATVYDMASHETAITVMVGTAIGWRMSAKVAKCETTQAQGVAARAEAVRNDEAKTAQLESKHAKETIYNADRLAALKTGIAVDVHGELERAHRLQLSADSRAATYRAQAEADSTARRDLADKASALDASLAEGVGVVAELGGALKQRDAEVAALCDQVNTERRLNGDVSRLACSVDENS